MFTAVLLTHQTGNITDVLQLSECKENVWCMHKYYSRLCSITKDMDESKMLSAMWMQQTPKAIYHIITLIGYSEIQFLWKQFQLIDTEGRKKSK